MNAQKFGNEVDAQVGFKTRKVTWLVKYADYRPRALA
jgi:hypothetical protein